MMKYHERYSNWPSFNQFNSSPDRQRMAIMRKLAQMLHAMGSSIDPDLQEAINLVRSGYASISPDASTEELVEALGDKELSVRANAAHLLGMRRDTPVEPLLNTLDDEQRFVRAEAARALGKLGEQVPIDPLVRALHDRDGSVRVAATQALGMLGKRVLLKDLLLAFSDSWPPVREAAVLALGKRGEEAPLETFLAALQDEDKFVRMAALSVLGTLEKDVAIEPLVAALADEQKQVRTAAIRALFAQGKRMPLQVLRVVLQQRMWSPTREAAVRVLSTLDKRGPLELLKWASDRKRDSVCTTAKPTLLRRYRVSASVRALLRNKQDFAKTVTAMKSCDERLVKSKMGRLRAWPSLQFLQAYTPDWTKNNKTLLVIVSTILCTSFVLYHRKRIVSTVLDNALRIFRLPQTLTHKYVIRPQKTGTAHL